MAQLGGWEGYEVSNWHREQRGAASWLVIAVVAPSGAPGCCSGCGQPVASVHDRRWRRIRDLPIFGDPVELRVQRRRLACSRCGPRLEHLAWLDLHARVTRRLARSSARLCAVTSVRHAAGWHGLDWKTAKAIDMKELERTLGPTELEGVRLLEMDEVAIQKGHRYATVVVDVERKRVLWVGRGRSRAEVRPFFELLGPRRCAQIQAVAIRRPPGLPWLGRRQDVGHRPFQASDHFGEQCRRQGNRFYRRQHCQSSQPLGEEGIRDGKEEIPCNEHRQGRLNEVQGM
ncbi:transposase family protein [Luteimonas sp. Y-2-2-4F]|nr:transposase family protein [Luteimonas sp. Y-2-2-4F]MCD9031745.1 transposase family protein [Luteimonas sp. Y-2-2-4F]